MVGIQVGEGGEAAQLLAQTLHLVVTQLELLEFHRLQGRKGR